MRRMPWLREHPHFKNELKDAAAIKDPAARVRRLRALSDYELDFIQTQQLERALPLGSEVDPKTCGLQPIRLAILASSTVDHLAPAIRVAGLRRGLWVDLSIAGYNQYRQEILDETSALYRFKPDVVLLALDTNEADLNLSPAASREEAESRLNIRMKEWAALCDTLRERTKAVLAMQTLVIPPKTIFGQMDPMVPAAPSALLHRMNDWILTQASEKGLLILDINALASEVGTTEWCHEMLWFHAKQAVSPAFAPLYGDRLARLLAAVRGLSFKVLVLDLDNTLWGGVVGDDGVEGLEIGQGTALGEAHLAFQHYAKQLKERGVLLAVCSKNEDATARSAFEQQPEMKLKLNDFAVFVANWEDKAANLQRISKDLNVGLDSLVFFDDNPAERALVRQFLPMVAVPEAPEDPSEFVRCLSGAGYFESIAFTADDRQRAEQYRANAVRRDLETRSHDVNDFLMNLQMQMTVAPFDAVGAARIAQLINKSNQFNLTTRRYTLEQVQAMAKEKETLTLQISLKDQYGDSGMIAVLIAKPVASGKTLLIDTWLMSCRVLGRQVEEETLNQLALLAKKRGAEKLVGDYISTAKNKMVEAHYPTLKFKTAKAASAGETRWELPLKDFAPKKTFIHVTLDERLLLCPTPR